MQWGTLLKIRLGVRSVQLCRFQILVEILRVDRVEGALVWWIVLIEQLDEVYSVSVTATDGVGN